MGFLQIGAKLFIFNSCKLLSLESFQLGSFSGDCYKFVQVARELLGLIEHISVFFGLFFFPFCVCSGKCVCSDVVWQQVATFSEVFPEGDLNFRSVRKVKYPPLELLILFDCYLYCKCEGMSQEFTSRNLVPPRKIWAQNLGSVRNWNSTCFHSLLFWMLSNCFTSPSSPLKIILGSQLASPHLVSAC